jgi:alkylation response protein AidB-like acyl-CoA dehydrogenase
VFESARDAWQAVCRTGELSPEHRALIRLTAAEATSLAVQATELMHRAGGATAILRSSPLDRCWRDIQAAARNIAVTEDHFAAVGKLLLGATAAA